MKKKIPDHMILAIHVTNRLKQVSQVQEILTRYGKFIKTRVGLHEATGRSVSPTGIIVLECISSRKQLDAIQTALNAISGVESEAIIFSH